jgi:hypothetical protein
MTESAWRAEGALLFGPDPSQWKFRCPCCGHVAKVRDFPTDNEGASPMAGFSCVGRVNPEVAREAFGEGAGPCNYAGGGLICLNPVHVKMETGEVVKMMEFASG